METESKAAAQEAPAVNPQTQAPPVTSEPKPKKHNGHLYSPLCKCGRCINITKGKENSAAREKELREKYFEEFKKDLWDKEQVIIGLDDETQKQFLAKLVPITTEVLRVFPGTDVKHPSTLIHAVAQIAIRKYCQTL